MLVAHNQLVQQSGILAFQPLRDRKALLPQQVISCRGGVLSEGGYKASAVAIVFN